MNLKKFMVTSIASSILLTTGVPVFASANGSVTQAGNSTEISTSVVEQSNDTIVSEVMSFDEIVSRIATDRGISIEEARNMVLPNNQEDTNSFARSSLAALATYRTFTKSLNALSTYKPTLNFYCQTNEGGGFQGIVKILDTTMNRVYNGISKQFSGTVFVNLENAGKIHYVAAGDFYNNGTTTVTGGGEVGIGGVATANFSVSSSSNWFGTIYEPGDYISAN